MNFVQSLVGGLRRGHEPKPSNHGVQPSSELVEYFFPNQPPHVMQLERRLQAIASSLSKQDKLELYSIFSHGVPSLTPTTFSADGDIVIAHQRDGQIAFPSPLPKLKFSHIVFGYEQWLQRKYHLPDFVAVERGDIVVDCGAYVGGFSLSASRIAERVHAFEPDEHNFRCASRNLPNATVNLLGLYNETKTVQLNISLSSVEHSLLQPDDGAPVAVRDIQVMTLKDYCERNRIARLDFVKIEAEGVELEVFEGLQDIRPRKLAIDVSPERDGESPAEEFKARLSALGYVIRQRGHVLFARQDV